jgi:hypothetical protein
MGEAAAGLVYRGGVNGSIAHLYERDLSFHVNNVGDTVAHAVGTQNAVGFSSGTIFEIAEEGE